MESCSHTHHWHLWEKLELKTRLIHRQFPGVCLAVSERLEGLCILAGGNNILYGNGTDNNICFTTHQNRWKLGLLVNFLSHERNQYVCELVLVYWYWIGIVDISYSQSSDSIQYTAGLELDFSMNFGSFKYLHQTNVVVYSHIQ